MTIKELLDKHFKIHGDVTINPSTGLVDVDGDVTYSPYKHKQVTELPVKFGKVTGKFTSKDNQLQSLAGAPHSVGGIFFCYHNQLRSLEGAPQTVGGSFYCENNHLRSLAGAPQTVGGSFVCNNNPLQSLAGAPQSVGYGFYCCDNQLQSLAGAPHSVGGGFYCRDNPLQSLDGLPKIIKGSIVITYDRNIPLLKLFMVKELKGIQFQKGDRTQLTPDAQEVASILNQYLPLGIKGMLPCAAELIKAGYRDNARL